MNEVELVDALVERLGHLFYGIRVMSRRKDSVELRDVKVFAQYIPQAEGITLENRNASILENYEENDFEMNFPCIIVKHVDRIDNEERSIVLSQHTVKLLTGVYDESVKNEGYRDVMNMMTMIRDDFFTNRFIGLKEHRTYRVLMPVKSRMIEADTWPVSYGEIELKVETGRKTANLEHIYERRADDGRGIYEGRIREGYTAG